MHEFTNLQWPETPFGAEQRPFGRRRHMLAAFAVDWADQPGAAVWPVAAATVYLPLRRHGPVYDISPDTLSIGFRTTVGDDSTEVPELLAVLDRALSRARRHAVILAGHRLGDDLARMIELSAAPLRGAVGVAEAWGDRSVRHRGLALMIDTGVEAAATQVELDLPLAAPAPATLAGPPHCPVLGRQAVGRAVAIALTAAVHAGRYRWDGRFPVARAVESAGWDVFRAHLPGTVGDPTGRPVPPIRA